MIRHGFDNDLYIQKQSEQIVRRITDFGGKTLSGIWRKVV